MRKQKIKVLLCGFVSGGFQSEHHYSLGLGYLKAYAEKSPQIRQNFDIRILDFAPGQQNYYEIIENFNAGIAGFSCYLWSTEPILEIIRKLHSSTPGTTIILGGATHNLEEHSASLPDGVLLCDSYQEGESVFLDVLTAYLKDGNYSNIAGLWTVGNGRIIKGKPSPPIQNPDTIPCPYSTKAMEVRPGNRCFLLEIARGCRHDCSFCKFSYRRGKMRYFSLERVAGQIKWAREHGVEVAHLLASAVNYDTRRFEALCGLLREANSGGGLKFIFCMHPAYISPAQIKALEGILPMTDSIVIGIQSLSETAMETMRRKFKAERLLRGVKLLSNVFPPNVDLIIGLPGETIGTFQHSVRTLLEFPIHLIIHHFSVLPGTRYHEKKNEYRLQHKDHRESYLAVSNDTFTAGDYDVAVLFLETLSDGGDLDRSNILSINMGDKFSFHRGLPRDNEEVRSQACPDIESHLLEVIEPFVRLGAEFQGWTVTESLAGCSSLNIVFSRENEEIHLLLLRILDEEPHFARTAHFYIIYTWPDTLSPELWTWLRSFAIQLSRADRPDI